MQDPSPRGFGFRYDEDTSIREDGRTRILAYTKTIGSGEVAYISLGHCHDASSNIQPFVDESLETSGKTPLHFRGTWELNAFEQLLSNAVAWGLDRRA